MKVKREVEIELDDDELIEGFARLKIRDQIDWISRNFSVFDLFSTKELLENLEDDELRDELLKRTGVGRELV